METDTFASGNVSIIKSSSTRETKMWGSRRWSARSPHSHWRRAAKANSPIVFCMPAPRWRETASQPPPHKWGGLQVARFKMRGSGSSRVRLVDISPALSRRDAKRRAKTANCYPAGAGALGFAAMRWHTPNATSDLEQTEKTALLSALKGEVSAPRNR